MTETAHRENQLSSNEPFRRPSVNITPIERTGRILIGAIGIGAGIVLLAGGGTVLTIVFEVLLLAAGFDLVITGALGHCPLYSKLGQSRHHSGGTHDQHTTPLASR